MHAHMQEKRTKQKKEKGKKLKKERKEKSTWQNTLVDICTVSACEFDFRSILGHTQQMCHCQSDWRGPGLIVQ